MYSVPNNKDKQHQKVLFFVSSLDHDEYKISIEYILSGQRGGILKAVIEKENELIKIYEYYADNIYKKGK